MSNAIYPDTLPGRAWPRKRAPVWKTTIKATPSGREWRSASMLTPRYRYTLQYNFLRSNAALQYQTLFAFFNARSGSFDSFLFRDPDDNTVTAQPFGVGDGAAVAFTLLRSLGGYSEPVGAVAAPITVQMTGGLGGIGSFEAVGATAGLGVGWSTFVGGAGDGSRTYTLSRTPTGSAKHGSSTQFMQITAVGNSNDSGIVPQVRTPIVPGQQYTLSASIRASVAGKVYLTARVYDAAVGSLGDFSTTTVAVTGGLVDKSVTFTAPALAASADISVRGINAVGEYFEVDAVQLVPGAAVPAVTSTVVALMEGGDYSLAAGSPVLTLTRAAASGAILAWSGSYYWRCRFDADDLPFEQFMSQFWKTGEVKLITVKP